MRRAVRQGVVGLLILTSVGCTSHAPAPGGGTIDAGLPFNGSWAIPWCSRTDPRLDCGGFAITLFQEGSRICGDFTGALVNLRQIDEGEITGTAAGNVATLAVKSGRSDVVLQIHATRVGRDIQWKQVGVIEDGGTDINVIALDEVLAPAEKERRPLPEACRTAAL